MSNPTQDWMLFGTKHATKHVSRWLANFVLRVLREGLLRIQISGENREQICIVVHEHIKALTDFSKLLTMVEKEADNFESAIGPQLRFATISILRGQRMALTGNTRLLSFEEKAYEAFASNAVRNVLVLFREEMLEWVAARLDGVIVPKDVDASKWQSWLAQADEPTAAQGWQVELRRELPGWVDSAILRAVMTINQTLNLSASDLVQQLRQVPSDASPASHSGQALEKMMALVQSFVDQTNTAQGHLRDNLVAKMNETLAHVRQVISEERNAYIAVNNSSMKTLSASLDTRAMDMRHAIEDKLRAEIHQSQTEMHQRLRKMGEGISDIVRDVAALAAATPVSVPNLVTPARQRSPSEDRLMSSYSDPDNSYLGDKPEPAFNAAASLPPREHVFLSPTSFHSPTGSGGMGHAASALPAPLSAASSNRLFTPHEQISQAVPIPELDSQPTPTRVSSQGKKGMYEDDLSHIAL